MATDNAFLMLFIVIDFDFTSTRVCAKCCVKCICWWFQSNKLVLSHAIFNILNGILQMIWETALGKYMKI
ncbi:hypothetical protein ES288_D05G229000v1 [Gossypium darwinii]|uniref:Uncharacterized protein n=1 Tax=Gossypium darwinii TaxID=34276 RepID=A0A5D2CIQ7_GOSDA|nr:hypothetical protein ES288_D05G229000v1 [Gossypium darwinii]